MSRISGSVLPGASNRNNTSSDGLNYEVIYPLNGNPGAYRIVYSRSVSYQPTALVNIVNKDAEMPHNETNIGIVPTTTHTDIEFYNNSTNQYVADCGFSFAIFFMD